jgi:hypothetical protein
MLRYGITIFLGAWLLFQIQPLIARSILPWFGGTAAVWTGCMLFFQTFLLLGYGYAYVLQRWLSWRNGWLLHSLLLLAAALFAMPIPPDSLQPDGTENLTWGVWSILLNTIAIPFIALSATSPLIQAWQSETHPQRSPYPLYALSNAGSLLALITYPLVFEPWLTVGEQSIAWRIALWIFVVLCLMSGLQVARNSTRSPRIMHAANDPTVGMAPKWKAVAWLGLALTGSVVLLATTNLLCQEIAAVPLLWIAPLTIYLLSFVICFDYPQLYQRWFFVPFLTVSSILAVLVVLINVFAGVALQIVALLSVCFAATMTCHGELERLKPNPQELTKFYFLVALGGALGGFGVAVLAPKWFTGFYEFHLGLLASLAIMLSACYCDHYSKQRESGKRLKSKPVGLMISSFLLLMAFSIVASSLYFLADPSFRPNQLYRERNEYGLLAVEETSGYRKFIHGQIEHGGEFVSGDATSFGSYYHPGSGVAIAIEAFREFKRSMGRNDAALQVGVVGLGIGGMLAWSQPGDKFTFFELSPAVERIARDYFRYLSQTPAETEVLIGDGRIQLQRRAETMRQLSLTRADGLKFDLLFLDAFASDAIPIHLMTAECFKIYLNNLADNGVLVAHISNRFVDLRPVVYQLARENQLTPILIETEKTVMGPKTRWILMARNQAVLKAFSSHANRVEWPSDMKPIRWSDDRSSLFDVIDWSGKIDWSPLTENFRQQSGPTSTTNQK